MPHHDPTSHPAAKKRVVTVDGLRYSLETGNPVGRAKQVMPAPVKVVPRTTSKPAAHSHVTLGERPLPKAIHQGEHHQSIIHPDYHQMMNDVEHPPAHTEPTRVTRKHHRTFFMQVILQSFRRPHERQATNAVLGATLLAPFYWLLVALPWILSTWIYFANQPTARWYSSLYRLVQSLSFAKLAIAVLILTLVTALIWLARHILLLVNYGINLRHIDHRQANATQLWRQSLAKIGRFSLIAIVDSLSCVALIVGTITLIIVLTPKLTSPVGWQSLSINVVLLIAVVSLVFLSIHRPLSRVMLAATNQPVSFIVSRSYGLIRRSRGLAVVGGLVWLLIAGLTAIALGGIVLATINYGFFGVGRSWLAQAGLAIGSAVFLYAIIAIFSIWSQSYWTLAYHYLAHRFYRKGVSDLFVTDPHPKSASRALGHIAIVLAVLLAVIFVILLFLRQPINDSITGWQRRLPAQLQDLLPKR